jgi:hypothetical protein
LDAQDREFDVRDREFDARDREFGVRGVLRRVGGDR